MPQPSKRVTTRLPQDLVERLDRAARSSSRSRSEVIEAALEAYLVGAYNRPASLMLYAGAGADLSTRRTAEQVDAEIRWLHADE